ncbi:hypothetical protein [Solemya elarraichensis gill symbiont]|uniref:hypothetical protein n=1 Tax=Solemya elarraichensis gill symbiont TaxID=1918949 RepID=UPI001428C8F0|nr:hypothetical protein [Solemya elarraichensis gill symbiont]
MAEEITRIAERINNSTRAIATARSGQPDPVSQTAKSIRLPLNSATFVTATVHSRNFLSNSFESV